MHPEITDLDKPIFGARAFLQWLPGRNLKQVYYALQRGLLDADKYGDKWVSTPRRLLNQFAGREAQSPPIGRSLPGRAPAGEAATA